MHSSGRRKSITKLDESQIVINTVEKIKQCDVIEGAWETFVDGVLRERCLLNER